MRNLIFILTVFLCLSKSVVSKSAVPVKYPLLSASNIGSEQKEFISFYNQLKLGCSKHYGVNYEASDVFGSIKAIRESEEIKRACLWPAVVSELNEFTKKHLKLKQHEVLEENIHLTLAARIYDFSYLGFGLDFSNKEEVADLFAVKVHMAILYRITNQLMPNAIKVSNPWIVKNNFNALIKLRELEAWMTELTPWGVELYKSVTMRCDNPFKFECEEYKYSNLLTLLKAFEQIKERKVLFGYIENINTIDESLADAETTSVNAVNNANMQSANAWHAISRGLSGQYTPFMMATRELNQNIVLEADLDEIFSYLKNGSSDALEQNTEAIKLEEFSCKTILRTFVALQKESAFSLKAEVEPFNPFSMIKDTQIDNYTPVNPNGPSIFEIIENSNCEVMRDQYESLLKENNLLTRFMAYSARTLLISSAQTSEGLTEQERSTIAFYAKINSISKNFQDLEKLSNEVKLSDDSNSKVNKEKIDQLKKYIENIINERGAI